jgi:DNA-binding transcriptional ArsR family regulator
MSGAALVWAANVKGLAPATKIVLIQLAERHNKDTGRCDPSLNKLADDCEMSRASVLRHLRMLEEGGLLTRVSQGRENGGRSSSQYDLHMGQRSQIETGGKGLKSEGQRSQIERPKVSQVRPPYIEPVLNPKEPNARDRATGSDEPALFSGMEEPQSQEDPVESGFEAFWKEIWPSHFRKAGKVDCRKLYRKACEGKHPKAEGALTPDQLNAAARRYIASVEDRQFLKAPKAWLNGALWEPWLDAPDRQHVRRNEDFMERVQ